MSRRIPRRQTRALGDQRTEAEDVLEASFGPLVPRRFGGLVAVAVTAADAGPHNWSSGTWGTLPADDGAGDRDPVFQIGSITKVFTALLLADAVAASRVDLDEPCETALGVPLRVGGRPVTYRQLATHRAGLPKVPDDMRRETVDERDPYRTYDEARLVTSIKAAKDRVKAGRDAPIRYSNFGFAILGLALSRRLGTPWEAALRDRILAPAGLVDTAVRPSNPRAVRVDERGELVGAWELAAFAPAGGLWMSTADLGRWLTLLTEAVRSTDSSPTRRRPCRPCRPKIRRLDACANSSGRLLHRRPSRCRPTSGWPGTCSNGTRWPGTTAGCLARRRSSGSTNAMPMRSGCSGSATTAGSSTGLRCVP